MISHIHTYIGRETERNADTETGRDGDRDRNRDRIPSMPGSP